MKTKLFKIFSLFFLALTIPSHGNNTYLSDLQKADSLFNENKFIESFTIYEKILTKSDSFSPEMLIKMAFIKEGLGDFTSTLYYLNLYYLYYPDKNALQKMEEVAARYRLTGYNYTDTDYFMSFYNKNYQYIIFLFLFGSLTFLVYLLYKKRKRKPLGMRPLLFILIMGVAVYINNFNLVPAKGIISKESLAMTAPSAGATIHSVLDKGHRVNIMGKEDIWYKIEWDEQNIFIRENNLLIIDEVKEKNKIEKMISYLFG